MFNISNKVYDTLKKIALAVSLLGTFYETLALIWGLPYGEAVSATAVAIVTALMGYLTKSSSEYAKKQNEFNDSSNDENGMG